MFEMAVVRSPPPRSRGGERRRTRTRAALRLFRRGVRALLDVQAPPSPTSRGRGTPARFLPRFIIDTMCRARRSVTNSWASEMG